MAWIDITQVIWADPSNAWHHRQTIHQQRQRRAAIPRPLAVRAWLQSQLDIDLPIDRVLPLTGGSVSQVLLLTLGELDNPLPASMPKALASVLAHRPKLGPHQLVLKLNAAEHHGQFAHDAAVLDWYHAHTRLRVPQALAVVPATPAETLTGDTASDDPLPHTCGLLLSHIPGVPMHQARLSPMGQARLQQQLAHTATAWHSHHAARFGDAMAQTQADAASDQNSNASPFSTSPVLFDTWPALFQVMFENTLARVGSHIPTRVRHVAQNVCDHLDQWLPPTHKPTLIHSDWWAGNVLVDDAHPDRPQLTGVIDCGATFANPEYELAGLRLFHTADANFFAHYGHRLKAGFETRCQVYWLHAMLHHIDLFGDAYLPWCQQLCQQLARQAA